MITKVSWLWSVTFIFSKSRDKEYSRRAGNGLSILRDAAVSGWLSMTSFQDSVEIVPGIIPKKTDPHVRGIECRIPLRTRPISQQQEVVSRGLAKEWRKGSPGFSFPGCARLQP